MLRHMARSSSGSGRRPLKAEITSSNLVRATKNSTGQGIRPLTCFLLKPHLSSFSGHNLDTAGTGTQSGTQSP